jgi:hypothetical protein
MLFCIAVAGVCNERRSRSKYLRWARESNTSTAFSMSGVRHWQSGSPAWIRVVWLPIQDSEQGFRHEVLPPGGVRRRRARFWKSVGTEPRSPAQCRCFALTILVSQGRLPYRQGRLPFRTELLTHHIQHQAHHVVVAHDSDHFNYSLSAK